MTNKLMKIKHKKISIIGVATDFYIYIDEKSIGQDCASNWLNGPEKFKLWHELKHLHKKDKDAFVH